MKELLDWLVDLNRFSALAGCLFFLYSRQSLKSVSGIVFCVLLISFAADNLNYFFIRLIYPNSFIIGNSWKIVNFFLMILLFIKMLSGRVKRIILALTIIFSITTIVSFFFYPITEANTIINISSNVTFILLVLISYLQLLKQPSFKLTIQPIFWIGTSFFVHSSLVLLQSIFENYLIFDQKISQEGYILIYVINFLANISKNFILFYALVLIGKGFPDSLKPVTT